MSSSGGIEKPWRTPSRRSVRPRRAARTGCRRGTAAPGSPAMASPSSTAPSASASSTRPAEAGRTVRIEEHQVQRPERRPRPAGSTSSGSAGSACTSPTVSASSAVAPRPAVADGRAAARAAASGASAETKSLPSWPGAPATPRCPDSSYARPPTTAPAQLSAERAEERVHGRAREHDVQRRSRGSSRCRPAGPSGATRWDRRCRRAAPR